MNKDILNRLDKICQEQSSEIVERIINFENIHANKNLTDFGRFIRQFDVYYSYLVKLDYLINFENKKTWPPERGVQWLTFHHNLKPIYSSFNRLIRGFYEDSLILVRPSYEAFIKVVWMSCYSERPYDAIDPSSHRFNLTNFVKQELKLDWAEYSILSAMTHSHWLNIFDHIRKNPKIVELDLNKNQGLLEIGISYISFVVYVYLKFYLDFFCVEKNKYITEQLLDIGKEMIFLRRYSFDNYPKPYWPCVMKDVDVIFDIIRRLDSGGKWDLIKSEIKKQHNELANARLKLVIFLKYLVISLN